MAREYMDFDLTPCDEECAQVGRDDYRRVSREEYTAMLAFIERTFGATPVGVSTTCKANAHDFGTYYQLRMYYDDEDAICTGYVYKVESELPPMWDAEARAYLRLHNALVGERNAPPKGWEHADPQYDHDGHEYACVTMHFSADQYSNPLTVTGSLREVQSLWQTLNATGDWLLPEYYTE